MCNCVINSPGKQIRVSNSWRLSALFRIENIIRELGQDARAKRIGICGNTIFVKVKDDKVLFQPQLRCKDRVCPVCNAYRASIMANKVEILGKRMNNPHMMTVTANSDNRDCLRTAFQNYKVAIRKLKRDKKWFKKYVSGGIEHIEVKFNSNTGWHIHSHMLVDLNLNRKVENLQYKDNGYTVDQVKKDLELVLEDVGLGKISDIRPVTEGYGKEISKYCLKFGLDIEKEKLKEIITVMVGKRMVSRFGNCFGVKNELEELTEDEEKEYKNHGTLQQVAMKCFKDGKIDSRYSIFIMEAVKLGLIEIESIDIPEEELVNTT